jgi:serine/threonine-protein kinase
LNGAYELNELLSAQESHEVYRATERKNGRGVRVKLLRAEFALQSEVVEHFLGASRSRQLLAHTSLPSVRVDSDDTGIPFVIEETVEGRPLDELIASFPQGVPLGLASHLLVPLVEALTLAHEQGLVHGAIDPARVRWLGTPTAPLPKLLELGDAREGTASCDAGYRAPELAKQAAASKQSDVFAVGVLTYRLLCGELPFRPGDKRALPLDEVAPQLPAAWVELTAKCLELDPKRRYADAAALLQAMRACTHEPSAAGKRELAPAASAAAKGGAEPRGSAAPVRSAARPVVAVDADKTREARAGAAFAQTLVSRPNELAPDAVAAAFAPLEGDAADGVNRGSKRAPEAAPGAKNRNSRAREIASKLSAKAQPRNDELPARDSALDVRVSAGPRPPQRTAAAPAAKAVATRAAGRQPLTQGQVAAVALTEAQLDALRALRLKNDDDDDRWVIFVMLTFFMVVLQLGVPLLYDPQLARAQALFGGKVPLVSAGFAVMVVIATARIWAARVVTNSLLMRATSFTMFVVAICIGVLCAAQFSGGVGSFAGIARKALPWGVSFLFFLFAFGGILRGVRSLPNHIVYGLLVLLASSGSLYGSYRAVFTTVLAGKHWSAARIVQSHTRQVSSPSRLDLDALKQQASDKTSMAKWQEEHQDVKAMEQRHEVGANEADDLKAVNEITDTRTRNQAALSKTAQAPLPPAPSE